MTHLIDLNPGGIIPVDGKTTSALAREIVLLRTIIAKHADAALADIFGTSEDASLIREIRMWWEAQPTAEEFANRRVQSKV